MFGIDFIFILIIWSRISFLVGIVLISITNDTRSVVIINLTTIITITTDTKSIMIMIMIIMVVTRCSLAYSAARPASGSISGVRNKQGLFSSH